jgi:MFS family permease
MNTNVASFFYMSQQVIPQMKKQNSGHVVMNMLTPSPFLISLLSTVASLPFFLFTLPAGALADMVDRKKLLCVVNLWLAAAAAGLAILGWLHFLNPHVILVFVFLIGVGFALNAPVSGHQLFAQTDLHATSA